jgi:hypothetical protein
MCLSQQFINIVQESAVFGMGRRWGRAISRVAPWHILRSSGSHWCGFCCGACCVGACCWGSSTSNNILSRFAWASLPRGWLLSPPGVGACFMVRNLRTSFQLLAHGLNGVIANLGSLGDLPVRLLGCLL